MVIEVGEPSLTLSGWNFYRSYVCISLASVFWVRDAPPFLLAFGAVDLGRTPLVSRILSCDWGVVDRLGT